MPDGGACVTGESLLPFYGYVGTAASAIVAAVVLASLYRARQRPWLRTWAWSWLFLTFHSLLSAVAYVASRTGVAAQPRVVLASLAAFAGFAQLVYLLTGAREVGTDVVFPRRRLAPVLAIAAVAAVLVVPPRLLGPLGGLPSLHPPLRRPRSDGRDRLPRRGLPRAARPGAPPRARSPARRGLARRHRPPPPPLSLHRHRRLQLRHPPPAPDPAQLARRPPRRRHGPRNRHPPPRGREERGRRRRGPARAHVRTRRPDRPPEPAHAAREDLPGPPARRSRPAVRHRPRPRRRRLQADERLPGARPRRRAPPERRDAAEGGRPRDRHRGTALGGRVRAPPRGARSRRGRRRRAEGPVDPRTPLRLPGEADPRHDERRVRRLSPARGCRRGAPRRRRHRLVARPRRRARLRSRLRPVHERAGAEDGRAGGSAPQGSHRR